jgi:uncharacterized RmlC-like cupin family protein
MSLIWSCAVICGGASKIEHETSSARTLKVRRHAMPQAPSAPDLDALESEGAGRDAPTVVTIRPTAETMTRQQLPYFVGIAGTTAGATGLSMNLVVIPPGGAAEPHIHRGYETAVYLLKGRVRTRYGPQLRQSMINEAGDFIFIPANVPHQPVNLSDTETAHAIVARNDPNEQESVVLYDPDKDELTGSGPTT